MSKPILCILGSTATGKSKLAIELALRFNGEIISADSMQLYKELDIISNKVTKEEQMLVKHHFLNIIEPSEVYTVTDFKRQADSVIKEIHNQNKLPIIVGGTYYYIESILYDKLIKTENDLEDKLTLAKEAKNRTQYTEEDLSSVENFLKHEIHTFNFDNVDSVILHDLLRQIDEDAANSLHPNDKRKVVRALQICQKTNTKYSDLMREQHKTGGIAKISGKLRFSNSLLLYLDIKKQILHERIDRRIDKMVERGLLEELTNFYNIYNEVSNENKFGRIEGKGIFQVIGFKEFNDYFNYTMKGELNGKKVTDETKIDNEEIKAKLISRGLDNLQIMTKKYSKAQVDWYENRILANINKRPTPPIFSFDVNDLNKWNEDVLEPSSKIVDHVLLRQQSVDNLEETLKQYKAEELKKEPNYKKLRYCVYCDKSIVDSLIWESHCKSKRHQQNYQRWLINERQNKLVNRFKVKLISKISLGIAIVSFLFYYFIGK